uniref:DMAP_binding domain-containing protein n=1 Tax=Gongylonema pulchrum TaxID=637853 RepID=A0A183E214_9BILA
LTAENKEPKRKVRKGRRERLPTKEALVLGLHSFPDARSTGPVNNEMISGSLSKESFRRQMRPERQFRRSKTEYRGAQDTVEKYAQPMRLTHNPGPQAGYSIPRPIPQRPRIMLPLTIGVEQSDDDELSAARPIREPFTPEVSLSGTRRRHPTTGTLLAAREEKETRNSRVLDNLRNNPALAGIFQNEALVERLSRPSVLSAAQRSGSGARGNPITTYPRLAAAKNRRKTSRLKPIDYKVKQIVEERPIPPPLFIPKGRHTRIRLTGATEKEIPGIGGRFVIPSLDPTLPALNSAVHTQGKQRDEYDSMVKLPNNWRGGDVFGLHTKTRTERLIGGNGMVDTPAIGKYTAIG